MAKHYAIADIHGMYDIYQQVCDMLEPDDVVYFLGDAGDRGYAGFKCIKAIYNNPQWIYLKGNHEDMMVKALRETLRDDDVKIWGEQDDFALWMYNGGSQTLEEWEKDEANNAWIWKLDKLPLIAEYTNSKGIIFHMSHAGYTCGHKDQMWADELLWNRHHFLDNWDEEQYPNDICIHGHTPIPHLIDTLNWEYDNLKPWNKKIPEARSYCNGHKICIDNGAFYSNATVLYDLDEMCAIPIFDREATTINEEDDEDGER